MIGARWVIDADETIRGLGAFSRHLPRTMGAAMRVFLLRFVRWAITKRFMGPGGKTDTLNRQTGNAIRSIAASPAIETTESVVRGRAGARPVYVKKHEEGGTYREFVPAHFRRRTALQRRAARRRLQRGGPSAARLIRTDAIHVRAHQRTVNYRARRMFRHTLRETRALGKGIFRQAMLVLLRKRRPPTMADLDVINVGLFGE